MKKSGIKFDARISMLVAFTAAFAIMVLGFGLIIFFILYFSSQNNKNIQYVLTNTSRSLSENIRYLEDGVISVRHNSVLKDYLTADSVNPVSDSEAEMQLAYSYDLFSERNRGTLAQPFVTRTYLFNSNNRHISIRYYPETLFTTDTIDLKYEQIVEDFNSKKLRYSFYDNDKNSKILLIRIYDDNMDDIGVCGVEINLAVIESQFEAVSGYNNSRWEVGYMPPGAFKPNVLISGQPGEAESLKSDADSVSEDIHLFSDYSFGIYSVMALNRSNVFYNFGWAAVVFLAISLFLLVFMGLRIVGLIRAVYDKELLSTKTQVNYLQSQLNPHFQYNILAMLAIRAKASGDEGLYQSLRAFSTLVRGKIFKSKDSYIALREELELIEFYLSLQKDRFGERLSYRIDCDDGLLEVKIPKLIIEPLVENAVEHGIEPKSEPGIVRIRIYCEDDNLFIFVEDDGVGIGNDNGGKNNTGTSIINTRQLLKVLYPNNHSINLDREDGITRVSIRIPVKYD